MEHYALAERFRMEGLRCVRRIAEAVHRLAARWQIVAEEARKQAESDFGKAEGLRADAERLTAELDRSRIEIEVLRADVKRYRFMSQPTNMSLGTYLSAWPGVVRGALRRVRGRSKYTGS
jgi:hypothetical protein